MRKVLRRASLLSHLRGCLGQSNVSTGLNHNLSKMTLPKVNGHLVRIKIRDQQINDF